MILSLLALNPVVQAVVWTCDSFCWIAADLWSKPATWQEGAGARFHLYRLSYKGWSFNSLCFCSTELSFFADTCLIYFSEEFCHEYYTYMDGRLNPSREPSTSLEIWFGSLTARCTQLSSAQVEYTVRFHLQLFLKSIFLKCILLHLLLLSGLWGGCSQTYFPKRSSERVRMPISQLLYWVCKVPEGWDNDAINTTFLQGGRRLRTVNHWGCGEHVCVCVHNHTHK